MVSDGQMGSAKQRKPVRNDLQTTGVMVGNGKVQPLTKRLVETRAPASRQTCCRCALQGEPPTPQDSHSRTTVVAKDVERMATPAGARREREGKPEATKKQDAEELRSEPSGGRRGNRREGQQRHATRLRAEEGLLCLGKTRTHDNGPVTLFPGLGCEVLPPMSGHPGIHLLKVRLTRARSFK